MTVGASPARDLRPQIREESSFFHEVQSRAGSLPQAQRLRKQNMASGDNTREIHSAI